MLICPVVTYDEATKKLNFPKKLFVVYEKFLSMQNYGYSCVIFAKIIAYAYLKLAKFLICCRAAINIHIQCINVHVVLPFPFPLLVV
jgi:hypothetical protein